MGAKRSTAVPEIAFTAMSSTSPLPCVLVRTAGAAIALEHITNVLNMAFFKDYADVTKYKIRYRMLLITNRDRYIDKLKIGLGTSGFAKTNRRKHLQWNQQLETTSLQQIGRATRQQ